MIAAQRIQSVGEHYGVCIFGKPKFVEAEKLSHEAFDSIAPMCPAHLFVDNHPDPPRLLSVARNDNYKVGRKKPLPVFINDIKLFLFEYPFRLLKGRIQIPRQTRANLQLYTESFFLPFARLRFKTALPFLVDILTRKPCVR